MTSPATSSSTAPQLVILAAGLGTRYGGLKQLDPMGPEGTALLDYAIADARRAGFGGAVLVVRAEIESAVREHLERTGPHGMPVELVHQRLEDLPGGRRPPPGRTKPWGTTHAAWAARTLVKGPFAVANGDDHYGRAAYQVLAEHLAGAGAAGPWALAGYRLGDVLSPRGPVNRGICRVDDDGWLLDVVEGRDLVETDDGSVEGWSREGGPLRLTGDETASTNLWAFTGGAMAFFEEELAGFLDGRGATDPKAECLVPDVVRAGLGRGACRVRVREVEGGFFGVTHPGDRPEVVERLARRGPP